jgi:hypothetical protein
VTRWLVAVFVVLSACDEQGGADAGVPDRLQRASQGLCDAQVAAFGGRIREAAEVFDVETHDFLHQLAARLQDTDRDAAAALLEAKQRVEAAFDAGSDRVAMQELLIDLQRALQDAADAAGLPAPLCREGAS